MSTFDPSRPLVMAKFKTVGGHNLNRGVSLTIAKEPSRAGEVDEAMARRLWAGGQAIYAEDFRPTPVESKEDEAARLLGGSAGEVALTDTAGDQIEPKSDLNVSNARLREIAAEEGVVVESDDNKIDLQRKIMEGRASRATASDEAPRTEIIGS